jgi:hypothetical protein
MYRYKTGAAMAADLKRAAHAVRVAVDNKPMGIDQHGRPINPRLARLCQITADAGISFHLPDLDPARRHRTATAKHVNYGESTRHRDSFGWYLPAMRDRHTSMKTKRAA